MTSEALEDDDGRPELDTTRHSSALLRERRNNYHHSGVSKPTRNTNEALISFIITRPLVT